MKGGEKINRSVKHLNRIIIFTFTTLICFLSVFNIVFFDIISMDKKIELRAGSTIIVPDTVFGNRFLAVMNSGSLNDVTVSANYEGVSFEPQENAENYEATISLYGMPVKKIQVHEVDEVLVHPGGQSIGILLQTDGVSVVGFSPVVLEDGSTMNPASEADLITGDFITSINGQKINSNADIATIINEAGQNKQNCAISYIRNGDAKTVNIQPQFCFDSESFRIGLYVRDNTAGIGTLSFYEPETEIFGALGHEVPDLEHGVSGEEKGTIVRAAVQGIKLATANLPGEKLGVFLNEDWRGDIRINSSFGIFGVLESPPETKIVDDLLPVATVDEVQTGAAEIYTVIEGEKIESFSINIIKLMDGYKLTGKGMVIEVTDPILLERTGGIVQGMSGSPIIQNDMFIGVVTHVFINDPTHGYACFGEWMLEDAGLGD